MITRVKMKDWKSHRDTDIHLGDGTNVLVGMMGSGKSSVLDAIAYALFGTLPAVQARRIKLEDLITGRPNPLGRAEVEVSFIAPDGNEYTVKRVIERGSGTTLSELRKATGEVIESPSSGRVNELIQSLLELDYDLFERAIYSEQNRLDYFLTLQRGRRMESIDELLGINKLEKARKSIGKLAGRVEDRAGEREATAKQLKQDPSITLLPTHDRELRVLESSAREISERLRQLQPELEYARDQAQQLRKTEQELVQQEKSYRELSGTMGALRQRIDYVRMKLGASAGASVDELRSRVGDTERAYGEKVSLANNLNSDLTTTASKLQGLETQRTMLQDELTRRATEFERKRKLRAELEALRPERLAEAVEKAQTEIRGVGDELAASRARIHDLKQAMDELTAAGATCPVCESPLEDARKNELLRQRRGQFEDLKRHADGLESRLRELGDDLRRKLEAQKKAMLLAKEVENIPKLEEERSEISKRLEEVELEIPGAKRESERLKVEAERARMEVNETYERLSGAKQALQLQIELGGLDLELRQRAAESEQVREAVERLKRIYDETKADGLRRRLEEIVGTQERLRAELSGKEQLLTEKRKFVGSIREKLALISRCEAEARHLRGAVHALTTIQTALSRTQTSMRRMFIDGVNEVMSDLWESVYPYGDFVGIQLAVEGGNGGDYVLKLRDRAGNWVPVEGVVSGGERTDACLALRIAFSIVLAPNLKWIVFDEPTHNLDAEGIQELAKVMRDRLPDVVKQILLITHEERLESAVSGYLYRFSRDKDSDEPTRVEQVAVPELFE